MPSGTYAPPDPVRQHISGGLTVAFHGDDNRRADYPVGTLPLPRWHQPLAAALAERIGPHGELRTLTSATSVWQAVGRLIRFLDQRPRRPAEPADLRVADLEAFYRHRGRTNDNLARTDLREVRRVLLETLGQRRTRRCRRDPGPHQGW